MINNVRNKADYKLKITSGFTGKNYITVEISGIGVISFEFDTTDHEILYKQLFDELHKIGIGGLNRYMELRNFLDILFRRSEIIDINDF